MTVFVQGLGAIAASDLNGFLQTAYNVATLRSMTGLSGVSVALVLGTNVPNDGGASLYYYNANGTYQDNNTTVIVPFGASTGAWLQVVLQFSGASFPTTPPTPGSGILWNNGGFLCIA